MSVATKGRIEALKAAAAQSEERKGWAWEHAAEAYKERDLLACALARCYPSHLMPHTHARKGADKRLTLCVHSPAGQLTFVVSEAMQELLSDLDVRANDWDGAKRADKHERISQLGRLHDIPTDSTK